MSKDEYTFVESSPVARYVDYAERMPDIPIGNIRNDRLEVCPSVDGAAKK